MKGHFQLEGWHKVMKKGTISAAFETLAGISKVEKTFKMAQAKNMEAERPEAGQVLESGVLGGDSCM